MMKVRLAWVWVAFSAVVLVGCSGGSQEGEDGSATPSDGGLSAETAPGADGLSAEAVADRYGYIEGTAQLTRYMSSCRTTTMCVSTPQENC